VNDGMFHARPNPSKQSNFFAFPASLAAEVAKLPTVDALTMLLISFLKLNMLLRIFITFSLPLTFKN
jgi:hypothetical protein